MFPIPQRVLRAYAGRLLGRLPKTAAGQTTGTASAASSEWHIKLSEEDIGVVCTIVSTCEYCSEVTSALSRQVAKTLDPPFGEQVGLCL